MVSKASPLTPPPMRKRAEGWRTSRTRARRRQKSTRERSGSIGIRLGDHLWGHTGMPSRHDRVALGRCLRKVHEAVVPIFPCFGESFALQPRRLALAAPKTIVHAIVWLI